MSDWKKQLIEAAMKVRKNAYCPYSHYQVGAALLVSGTQDKPVIISGCNVENSSYPCGNCAEKGTVSTAVAQGYQSFDAVAICTRDGGSPCGQCRQVLNEFGPTMNVILVNEKGEVTVNSTLDKILAYAFGPKNLQ